MITLSIDPSIHGHGAAVWENGELVIARFTGVFGGLGNPLLDSAAAVVEFVKELELHFDEVVIERPEHYSQQFQKGSQDDLARLSVSVGATMGLLVPHASAVLLIHPKTWKGQTPKDVTEHRAKETLTPDELSRIELPKAAKAKTDVWDAVGIGLWRYRKHFKT